MALRIAIVGPGRVGSAMAQRFARAGAEVTGFVGRTAAATTAAIAFCGSGRALTWSELADAHVVVFAVGDGDLVSAIAAALAHGNPRACSLWLHTSGRHGLDVFAAAGPRIRRGALHPAVPIPDAVAGVKAMAGGPMLLEAGARSERLLRRLCALLGTLPLPVPAASIDRVVYHAACALAANGLTALRAAVDRAFAAAGGLAAAERRLLADALMASALHASSAAGPAAALSGPVRRGDAGTVAAHLAGLAAHAPEVVPVYRALMLGALRLAADLPAPIERELRALLQPPEQD